MSPENVLRRLDVIYGTNGRRPEKPTPVQIQRYLGEQTFLLSLSEQTGITNLDFFTAVFFSKAGKFIPDKFQRFMTCFKEMVQKYGAEICNCIDEKCVKPNGEIQEARLRRNRRKDK